MRSVHEEIAKKALTTLASLRQISSDYLSHAFSEIAAIISSSMTSTSVRIHALSL
jgi:hypothetical protein